MNDRCPTCNSLIAEGREKNQKRDLEHPIYYKDDSFKTKAPSVLIEELRNEIVRVRGKLSDICNGHGFKDRIEYIEGGLTCILVSMSHAADEMKEIKKKQVSGEYINVRGIGSDATPGCFICGGDTGLHSNISGFVVSKDVGERIVSMFNTGARLDYREHEPNWIQVKIGSCEDHFKNLEKLAKLIYNLGGIITEKIVEEAKEVQEKQ